MAFPAGSAPANGIRTDLRVGGQLALRVSSDATRDDAGRTDWDEGWERDPQERETYRHIMERLYDLIRQEKPVFEEKIDPRDLFRVFVVEPQQSFARIRAQSGAFLVSAFHERFEREQMLKWNSGIPTYGHFTFKVSKESKGRILDELQLLNVTGEALFPGLDEAAKSVTDACSS